MLTPAGAVELARRDQDAALGEPGHGVAARLTAGGPQVQPRLRVLDRQSGRLHGGQEDVAAAGIPIPLPALVLVIGQCGDHRRLHRRGHHHAGVPAHGEEFSDHVRIARHETRAVTGKRAALRQRVRGQQARVVAARHLVAKQRHRFGIPAQADVALVGDHQSAALAGPADHLAKVVGAQHAAGGVARRIDVDERRPSRAELGQRVSEHHLCTRHPSADFVGGISEFGNNDDIVVTKAKQRRQPGDQLLSADHRQHRVGCQTGDPIPAAQRRHRGFPQRGCARGRQIAGRGAGRGQRFADQRSDRIDRRPDGQVHDAIGVRTGEHGRVGERVPREHRQ
jgi:hypothetical protein